jgi:hypothetical protein
VPTISSTLKINACLLQESFDCSEEFSDPKKELQLFGTVIDSDEKVIDDYTFQLKLSPTLSNFSEVSFRGSHIFIGLKWPKTEISILVSQLETNFDVKFSVLLNASEYFSRGDHEEVQFGITNITKAYSLKQEHQKTVI